MDERILNSNLFSKMICDEATRSDSHFNHLSVFLLPNEMGGSQTRLFQALKRNERAFEVILIVSSENGKWKMSIQ